jgi:mRNA interferase HigB
MRLITRRTLEQYAEEHAEAREALADLAGMIEAARWRDAAHLRDSSSFPARPIGGRRVVFNVKGNSYRVVVAVRYADESAGHNGVVIVKFVGTHAEYDRIDPETVEYRP